MRNGFRNTIVIHGVALCSLCIMLNLTSLGHRHKAFVTLPLDGGIYTEVEQGFARIEMSPMPSGGLGSTAGISSENLHGRPGPLCYSRRRRGFLCGGRRSVYFPLRYVILRFGLLAAFIGRFDGRFTLRSAIITTTIVAGLQGVAVGM